MEVINRILKYLDNPYWVTITTQKNTYYLDKEDDGWYNVMKDHGCNEEFSGKIGFSEFLNKTLEEKNWRLTTDDGEGQLNRINKNNRIIKTAFYEN